MGSARSCTPVCGLFTDRIFHNTCFSQLCLLCRVTTCLSSPAGPAKAILQAGFRPSRKHRPSGSGVLSVAWLLTTALGLLALFYLGEDLWILISFLFFKKITRIMRGAPTNLDPFVCILFAFLLYLLYLLYHSLSHLRGSWRCHASLPLNTPVCILQNDIFSHNHSTVNTITTLSINTTIFIDCPKMSLLLFFPSPESRIKFKIRHSIQLSCLFIFLSSETFLQPFLTLTF